MRERKRECGWVRARAHLDRANVDAVDDAKHVELPLVLHAEFRAGEQPAEPDEAQHKVPG